MRVFLKGMNQVKVFQYGNCSTCKKALKFLGAQGYEVEAIDITTDPPSVSELKKMLRFYDGNFRRLFNTSGLVYKAMKLSEKIGSMTEEDTLKLLEKNGRLVKRPFVLFKDQGLVGFDETAWKKVFPRA